MPLNPPPTIQDGLCLITQRLLRSDMTRAAQVDMAFRSTLTTSPTNALNIVNKFQAQFNADLALDLDSEVTCLAPSIRMGDGTTTPTEAVASGATTTGANAATYPPPQVAVLVKKLTPFGGKRNRGRLYMPFWVTSGAVSENGTITGGDVTTKQTRMASFLAGMADISIGGIALVMVIANKTINHAVTPPAVTAITTGPDVTALSVESLVATQRRRLAR